MNKRNRYYAKDSRFGGFWTNVAAMKGRQWNEVYLIPIAKCDCGFNYRIFCRRTREPLSLSTLESVWFFLRHEVTKKAPPLPRKPKATK